MEKKIMGKKAMEKKIYDQNYISEVYYNDRAHVLQSWAVQSRTRPMVVNEARGVYFWDGSGKQYLDMASQLVNSNIGHQHPKVVEAIKAQAEKLCFISPAFANEARSNLARCLSEICPRNINHFFFTNGGAEANDNAIKIARMATGRFKIISRYRSYHGSTFGAITLSGDPRRPPVEPGIPGIVRVFDPYCYRCTFGKEFPGCGLECANHIEEVIQYENPDTVAAIIVEAITGSNGIFIPPTAYMKKLREICCKYNILFIADEVMSGFGRTGEWFGMDNFGVVPDIMTMAKGVNSGYVPMGVVGVSDEIAEIINDEMLYCGLTYSGHPLACAASVATINAYREEKIIENAGKMGRLTEKLMLEMKDRHNCVGDARNKGLFGCLELVKDRKTKEPLVPWNSTGEAMVQINKSLLDDGVYMYLRWNYMFIAPPLIINEEQLLSAFSAIDKALSIGDSFYTG